MKAISIEAEAVARILNGTKRFEYRTWPTKHRGKIALHVKSLAGVYRGYISAVADLVDCKKIDGGYAFELQNVRAIVPVVHRGQQRIFNIPHSEDSFVYTDDIPHNEVDTILKEAKREIYYSMESCKRDSVHKVTLEK